MNHKKDVRRTLRFNDVKSIRLFRITKGQYRIIGYGNEGDYHLCEIELTDEVKKL